MARLLRKFSVEQIGSLKNFLANKKIRSDERSRVMALLFLDQGGSAAQIEVVIGLKYKTVVRLHKKFIENGVSCLVSKRREKEPRALMTHNQLNDLCIILQNQLPKDVGYDAPFWTSAIVADFIYEKYDIKYKSKTSIYLIFKKARLTYHKPDKKYKQRNDVEIERWKGSATTELKAMFDDPKAVVIVEDEMIITSQTKTQKVWFPEGLSPIVECANTRKRRCICGFLEMKSGTEFAYKSDRLTGKIIVQKLQELLKHFQDRTVYLFWDNASWHKSKEIKAFLETVRNLKLINFPPYAPELNPQEHVWKEAREKVTNNKFIDNIDTAADALVNFCNNTKFNYKMFHSESR